MTEAQRILISGLAIFLLVGIVVSAMVVLSRGAGMRQAGRIVEGRRAMGIGFLLVIAAMLALPLIDVVWQGGDERRETWRSVVSIVGAAVLFAPVWWRVLTGWIRGVDDHKRLVTWADLVARRSWLLTLACVFSGLSLRAIAVYAM